MSPSPRSGFSLNRRFDPARPFSRWSPQSRRGHSSPRGVVAIAKHGLTIFVWKFCMTVAGREIEGILEERGRAREHYDQAIAQGRRAAIAKEDRPSVSISASATSCPASVRPSS